MDRLLRGPRRALRGGAGIIRVGGHPLLFMRAGGTYFFLRGITSPPEGTKHSKNGQTNRKACQKHAHAAVKLRDVYVNLILGEKYTLNPLKVHYYLHFLSGCPAE